MSFRSWSFSVQKVRNYIYGHGRENVTDYFSREAIIMPLSSIKNAFPSDPNSLSDKVHMIIHNESTFQVNSEENASLWSEKDSTFYNQ